LSLAIDDKRLSAIALLVAVPAKLVERALEFVAFGFEKLFVGVGGDADGRGDANTRACEGGGYLEAVPA
jgi:hypothetical protein